MSDSIRISDIADFGAKPPPGKYIIRLLDTKPMKTKTDNHYPMVISIFEVVRGEWEGAEVSKISVFNTTPDLKQKGKFRASAIMDLKRTFVNAGRPLPSDFAFPLDEEKAAKVIEKHLGGLLLEADWSVDPKNDQYNRLNIIGLVSNSAAETDYEDEFVDSEYPYEEVGV